MALSLPPGVDLSKTPMMPNPNGDPPNFVDPPDRTSLAMGVGLPMVIISLFFLSLRLVSNLKNTRNRKLGLDDYLCIAGYIAMTAYFSVGMAMKNVNRHSWDVPLSILNSSFAKKIFTFDMLAAPAIYLPKLAIFALFLRLFEIERWVHWVSGLSITLNAMYIIAQCSVVLAACTPKHGAWQLRLECWKWVDKAAIAGGSVALLTDIIVLCLPLPIIYKMHLEPKKKLGLFLVFMAGILATICSIISLYYRVQLNVVADTLWLAPIVQACAFAEGYISIIVSCTPAIYSFWTNQLVKSPLFVSIRSSFSKSGRSQTSTTGPSGERDNSQPFSTPGNFHVTVLPMDGGLKRESIAFTEVPYRPSIRAITKVDQLNVDDIAGKEQDRGP